MTHQNCGTTAALFLKEWYKLRLFGWISVVLVLLCLGDYYLTIRTVIGMHGASPTWFGMIAKETIYFGRLLWALVGSGVLLAVLQCYPECVQGRIRLALHLPVAHWKVLIVPVVTGMAAMLAVGAVALCGMHIIHTVLHFPVPMSLPMTLTVLPWILAGCVAWCVTASVFSEPVRWRRVLIAALGVCTISMISVERGYNSMGGAVIAYALLCSPWLLGYFIGAMRIKG